MESNNCWSAEYNYPDLQFGDEEISIYAIFPWQIPSQRAFPRTGIALMTLP
jgi:hypothetical protein